MGVLDEDSALQEAPTEDMKRFQIEIIKSGGDRDEGYYGFKRCKRKSYREQVLETNNGAELQSVVQKLADRYIKRPA